jgi:predicted nucleic acid-binding protein
VDRGVLIADTDVLLDFLEGEGSHLKVATLLRAGQLGTTAVTVYEIWRGLESEAAQDDARRAFRGVRVFPLTDVAAKRAGGIHQRLRTSPIGERDTLIAGICLAINRPLLTRNVRHFRRVPGLQIVTPR